MYRSILINEIESFIKFKTIYLSNRLPTRSVWKNTLQEAWNGRKQAFLI